MGNTKEWGDQIKLSKVNVDSKRERGIGDNDAGGVGVEGRQERDREQGE